MVTPKAGEKLTFRNEIVGTFDGDLSPCMCGGDSYHVLIIAGGKTHASGLCANSVILTDDGWNVAADSEDWFQTNVIEFYAETDKRIKFLMTVTGMTRAQVIETFGES